MSIENQQTQQESIEDLKYLLEGYKMLLAKSKLTHEELSRDASTRKNKVEFGQEAKAIGKILASSELTKIAFIKYRQNQLLGVNRDSYVKLYNEINRS